MEGIDKIKLAQRTIAMLSSMVDSGEVHTSRSREMKDNALEALKQSEDVVLDGVSVSFEVGEKVLHTTRTEVEVSAFCEDKEQIEVDDGCDWYRVDKDELSKIHSR